MLSKLPSPRTRRTAGGTFSLVGVLIALIGKQTQPQIDWLIVLGVLIMLVSMIAFLQAMLALHLAAVLKTPFNVANRKGGNP